MIQVAKGEPGAVYWAVDLEREHLTATTPEEAMEEWVDEQYPNVALAFPATVQAHGFARMEVTERWKDSMAERCRETMMEHFEEEFGRQGGDPYSEDTPAQIGAARAFVDAYLADCHAWYEPTGEVVTVDVVVPPGADFPRA